MRVERLEVFGFKSFMERLILPLEAGITGVVGPNGCGKSNIIDALRWVLGETRASQLRGGVLEDVIFNGTETLRPLGLAEVSVVVRADTKGNLFDELLACYEQAEGIVDDIRSEGAPERVNNDQLNSEIDEDLEVAVGEFSQDAANTDSISGVSIAEGYSDAVVTDTRDFADDIRASLAKYSWLRSVSEVQVTRRLYRSGESEFFINKVACRLKDVKELFRVLGLTSRGYTIIAQGEIGRIISAKPDDRRLVIEEAAHIAGFRENINAVGKRLEDTRGQVVRLDDVIKEVSRQVSNLKRQAARAITRAQLKEELSASEKTLFADTLARLRHRIAEVQVRAGELEEIEREAGKGLYGVQQREQEARDRSMQFDADIEQLRGNSDAIKESLHRRSRELQQGESKVRELTSLLQSRNAEIQKLEERKRVLGQRLVESKGSLAQLESQALELEEKIRSLDVSGEEELKDLTQTLSAERDRLRELERSIREVRDRLVSAQSRRDALQSQMTAASPVEQLKRAVGRDGEIPDSIKGDYKLLVDGIKIPDRYTKALQSVLAERASFLVVDEVTAVARSFQEMVLKADPANKRGLGIGLFASLGEAAETCVPSVIYPGVEPLLTHVETVSWSRGLVTKLLSKVWIAPDLDTALKFIENESAKGEPDPDTVVVTEAGDLLSPWSFYSLRHDGGVIQIKSKVDEALRTIEENQGVYDTMIADRDRLTVSIAEGERRYAELTKMIQESQKRLREISNQQAEIRGRILSESKICNQLGSDLERIEPQSDDARGHIERLEVSMAEAVAQLEKLTRSDDSELEAQLQGISGSLRELEDRRRALRDEFSALLKLIDEKRRAHEDSRERLVRERMVCERMKGELSSAESVVRDRYGDAVLCEIHGCLSTIELLAHDRRAELEEQVSSIRHRLEREGEVDPGVVEQHEIESKRLRDLELQREDLLKASETLQVTLTELSEACTRRFVSTFEAIRSNFAVLGPKLFGGGLAELRLMDPSNPLESGVEVFVRPPGKKPKSIDLLSGGEKALCAIAFVFSMFMVRPSPMCVLDEVDAPLDEANVQRFVAFIKEMSARTQFLMITHNKASMAAADTLVGVTMPQPGASKILTVSLQEAERQVA